MAGTGLIKIDNIQRNNSSTGVITLVSPITLTSQSLLSTPLAGTLELYNSIFYVTVGTSRIPLAPIYPKRITPGELTLSYVNSTTFGVSVGTILDTTYSYPLGLSVAWTKTVSSWAAGTGNGALDIGSVSASTTYHVFLIRKNSDGSTDILISASATAPNMPTGYTYKRRIGCFRTYSDNTILKFFQHGNIFRFDVQQNDYAIAVFASTNRILQTVSAPENCIGIFQTNFQNVISSANHWAIFQATEETDIAPSVTNCTHYAYLGYDSICIEMYINVDSNRKIAVRGDSTSCYWRLATVGFIDPLI